MKTKSIFFLLIISCAALSAFSQSRITKASIKVYGNCVMCKKRIETVLDHKGIKQAIWNPRTKMLDVVYNNSKISELQIQELVASVGHDTDQVKAKDDVYALLPFCCLYRSGDHAATGHTPK